eukprot:gene9079-1174_t
MTYVKLLEVIKDDYKLISIGIVGLALATGITLIVPYKIGQLVDVLNLPPDEAKEQITNLSYLLAGLFGFSSIFSFVRFYTISLAGQRVSARLRKQLFTSIMKQESTFFDMNKSGELNTRLNTDIQIVSETLTSTVVSGLRSSVEAVAGIAFLFYLNPKLSFISFLTLPVIGVIMRIVSAKVKSFQKKYLDALADANSVADEKINSFRTVRNFGAETREIDNYSKLIEESYKIGKKVEFVRAAFFATTFSAFNISLIAILNFGANDYIQGAITLGELTSFLMYSIYVGATVTGVTSAYGNIMKSLGSSERIFQIIDRKPEIPFDMTGKIRLDKPIGRVQFKNIKFAYPTRKESSIFENLSFTVEPGQVIAFVGQSGVGKSTIPSLLTRLYDPAEGEILIDDLNLKDLNIHHLRENVVGVVSQEPILFSGTIKENIKYGLNREVTDEEIKEVSKKANAHDFIQTFPSKYDTQVGEKGQSLSGGQKQRISIARALIKNPKILILDEASSALDSESESLVQEAIQEAVIDRTVFIIAHRLSTVRNADLIGHMMI